MVKKISLAACEKRGGNWDTALSAAHAKSKMYCAEGSKEENVRHAHRILCVVCAPSITMSGSSCIISKRAGTYARDSPRSINVSLTVGNKYFAAHAASAAFFA